MAVNHCFASILPALTQAGAARRASPRRGRMSFNLAVDGWRLAAHGKRMTDRLDTVFAALADPTRRRILVMLLEDDMAVTDVAEPFEMSLAAISKHLSCWPRRGSSAARSAGA
jgi:hypothetical protein